MTKAGEKQKRRPKIKDAKQSERFKEAARELGAEASAEFDVVLGELLKTPKRPLYEVFRHRIYNGHCMVKLLEAAFPGDLKASEWKRFVKTDGVPTPAALADIKSKGYHLYSVDMSEELGANTPPTKT